MEFSVFLGYNRSKKRRNDEDMITADCHLHTTFSTDGKSPIEDMILAGIEKGLSILCFTEHMDYGVTCPEEPDAFKVDTDRYYASYINMKEKYSEKIRLLFGVELGLTESASEFVKDYTRKYPFDFIIGSSHTAGGIDPYYPAFFENRTEEEAYRFYFESELSCAASITDFDVYGHLDYALRYGPTRNRNFSYQKYGDLLDTLLKTLIENGKGIECNSSGFKYGMGHPMPHTDILKRYRELGGEIITIGSDAHETAHVAHSFPLVKDVLTECGFRYYTVFEGRVPSFYAL